MPSWTPAERLSVVERMQARSGADSESFFDAHGLGRAYRSAGDKNSKNTKVNAALYAAEQRGDLLAILTAAQEYLKMTRTDHSQDPEARDGGALAVAPDKRIFLSHASADRAIGDLLRNTLVLGGVPEKRIFYSSSRGTGIPSGEDVRTYLQRSLRESGLVIELVSEIFLTRPMCLMELGGAWTLDIPTYPIVVPPLTRERAIQQIGNVQIGSFGSDRDIDELFDELSDRLASEVQIYTQTAPWNRAIREFKDQLSGRLTAIPVTAPTTTTVSSAPDDDEVIAISNTSVVTTAHGTELHGEATNNDNREHTALLKATFYGSDNKIVGTATGVSNQLRPGGTKTFTLREVPQHARYKVEVDTLL